MLPSGVIAAPTGRKFVLDRGRLTTEIRGQMEEVAGGVRSVKAAADWLAGRADHPGTRATWWDTTAPALPAEGGEQ